MFHTIWGYTDHQQKLAEGVYSVTTPGHGGIIVKASLANRYLSETAKSYSDLEYGWYHFEEDCLWAVFAKENPSLFTKKEIKLADDTILEYYPELISERLAKWFGDLPFRTRRAALESISFPFDTSGTSDETMQAIVDEAKAEANLGTVHECFSFEAAVRDAAIRHGIPFKSRTSDWRVTDDSCNQRFRIHVREDGKTLEYEYEQDTEFETVSDTIVVQDYDYRSEDFASTYLLPYGYKDIQYVRSIYGVGWEQIVAECIFETDNACA